MSDSRGTVETSTFRHGCFRALIFLLQAGLCVGVAWFWTVQETRTQLQVTARSLQPVLTRLHPGIDREMFSSASIGFRLSLFTSEEEILLAPGPVADNIPISPPSLRNPGQAIMQNGRILLLFPVHERGEPRANAVLSVPYRQLWPDTLRKSLLLFLLLLTAWSYKKRIQRRAEGPRDQLIDELETLQADSTDRRLRLPFDSPFQSVAETINQLLTRQERKDRLLSEQHHQQQVLLNNMSEGILTLDNDQRISGCNPAAALWLHLGTPQRIRGERFYTCCRIPRLLAIIETVRDVGLQEEYIRLERSGTEDRIVKVKASLLIDQDQTMGVLLVLQDVTTLRRLETLRQDFVSNVTHELRTPLTAIKGYAELMVEEPELREDTRNYLQRILKQSTRMINIIEDLLSLTRIEDPDDSPSLIRTELRPVFESVIHLCDEQRQLRDLTLELDCEERLSADLHPALFEQAIHNLVHNAVKYTTPGTIITLRADQRNDTIRIEIQDEGPGIPEADQPRIFERFYRVDKARSRAVGGTGLGLSIVKHIVRMHGGKVGVTSVPGEGATFWIELPAS
jgi:two-component system phosphate regulon sensor histidine kinase PhoR